MGALPSASALAGMSTSTRHMATSIPMLLHACAICAKEFRSSSRCGVTRKRLLRGNYYQVHGAINQPKGVQKPHIPLLIGGGGEKVTLKLVAQYGDACNIGHLEPEATARKFEIMHKHCEEVGRDYHDINRTILLNCSIAETDEQALERAQTVNFARNTGGLEHLRPRALIGTPEMIRQRLNEYEQSGAQEVILYFPAPEQLESLRMFAREVMGK